MTKQSWLQPTVLSKRVFSVTPKLIIFDFCFCSVQIIKWQLGVSVCMMCDYCVHTLLKMMTDDERLPSEEWGLSS